jgi:hypothetical protein
MMKRQAMEALDYSMRDIMDCKDLPFDGKTHVVRIICCALVMAQRRLMKVVIDDFLMKYVSRTLGIPRKI